jgi:hypothetical protein
MSNYREGSVPLRELFSTKELISFGAGWMLIAMLAIFINPAFVYLSALLAVAMLVYSCCKR